MILPIISELSGLLYKEETEASGAMIDSIPLSFFRVKEAINGENTAKNGNHICCWVLSFFCFRVETFWEYDQKILTFDWIKIFFPILVSFEFENCHIKLNNCK